MSEQKKSPVGRPTKYKPEYCQELIEFFDREPYRPLVVDGVALTDKNGRAVFTPCEFPTFERFAYKIGVHRETLRNWCDKYPDFFAAYKKAEMLQKDILIQNGLMGQYEKTFAIFTAKNVTDMRDKQEIDHRSGDGSMTPRDSSAAVLEALRRKHDDAK